MKPFIIHCITFLIFLTYFARHVQCEMTLKEKLIAAVNKTKPMIRNVIPIGDFDPVQFSVADTYEIFMELKKVEVRGAQNFDITRMDFDDSDAKKIKFDMDETFSDVLGMYGEYSMNGTAGKLKVLGTGPFTMALHKLILNTIFEFNTETKSTENYRYKFVSFDKADTILENLTLEGEKMDTALMETLGKELFNQFESAIHKKIEEKLNMALDMKLKQLNNEGFFKEGGGGDTTTAEAEAETTTAAP